MLCRHIIDADEDTFVSYVRIQGLKRSPGCLSRTRPGKQAHPVDQSRNSRDSGGKHYEIGTYEKRSMGSISLMNTMSMATLILCPLQQ